MLTLNFFPFPIFKTERLVIRRITNEDADEIIALRSDPENMKYIPRPLIETKEQALEHIAQIDSLIESKETINWGITLKDNPEMIGFIGFFRIKPEHYRAEIGYLLLPEFHRKGIISEAVKTLIDYGFNTMKLHSIEAVIDPHNLASERVLQKIGFVKEGHFKESEYYEGRFLDKVIYSLLNKKNI